MSEKEKEIKKSYKLRQLSEWYGHYAAWLQRYADCMQEYKDVLQHLSSVTTLFETE